MTPRMTTKVRGISVAIGLFVLIDGKVCRMPLTRKKTVTTFMNYSRMAIGRKVKMLYFVVLSRFVGFAAICSRCLVPLAKA